MGIHSAKTVEELIAELQARHEKLVAEMRGKPSSMMAAGGQIPGTYVKAQQIRYATDDVATSLREIKSILGKG